MMYPQSQVHSLQIAWTADLGDKSSCILRFGGEVNRRCQILLKDRSMVDKLNEEPLSTVFAVVLSGYIIPPHSSKIVHLSIGQNTVKCTYSLYVLF